MCVTSNHVIFLFVCFWSSYIFTNDSWTGLCEKSFKDAQLHCIVSWSAERSLCAWIVILQSFLSFVMIITNVAAGISYGVLDEER